MNTQDYSSRSNARRAAVADLGSHFQIVEVAGGRFSYIAISGPAPKAEANATPKAEAKPKAASNNRDKYGLLGGSKHSKAAAMLEKGCKMADLQKAFGRTFYDLVKRLKEAGHTIDREENLIRLTARP